MIIRELKDGEDLTKGLLRMVEENTGKEIFTMRCLDRTEEEIECLCIFKDTSVLMGLVKVQEIQGKMALRLLGNYI